MSAKEEDFIDFKKRVKREGTVSPTEEDIIDLTCAIPKKRKIEVVDLT
jgi:hypothetical protein